VLAYTAPFISPNYFPDIKTDKVETEQNRTAYVIGTTAGEYLPFSAFKNQEYIINRNTGVKLLEGRADVYGFKKQGSNISFKTKNTTDGALLELPLIYYSGYRADIVTQGGVTKKLPVVESPAGFCAVKISGNATVHVSYKNGAVANISLAVSIIGAGILLVSVYRDTRRGRRIFGRSV